MFDNASMIKRMEAYALINFGKKINQCNSKEKYTALSKAIMEDIVPKWIESEEKFEDKKKAYYFSAEFLMGRALSNNLINMEYKKQVEELLEEIGINYSDIEDAESDAGLGNGGLGRLAACFLDSAATLDYHLMGYGIRYQYGIFNQSFVDGFQVEEGDNWLEYGEPWSIRKDSEKVVVSFSDGDILAVPYDTPIIGHGGNTINTLRLWQSEAIEMFNFKHFNNQNYEQSVREKNNAEVISRVLYPNDSNDEGKKLRLKQQYFFVSASIQDLVNKHLNKYGNFDNFAEIHAIQLNDTHPAVAIPELMRILTNNHKMDWSSAWDIAVKTFAYTNHTILKEALEVWSVDLYRYLLPNVYEIIEKINYYLVKDFEQKGFNREDIHEYEIIHNNQIRMAWLSIYGTHSTNGVAQLHSDLLADRELNNWYKVYPERFNNKTNGITQRRWLLKSNPELSQFITELLQSDAWITDLDQLKKLGAHYS